MTSETATSAAAEALPVARYLSEHHIPYRLFRHAGPVQSLEQSARERGQRPEQVVRSIVFRIAGDEFVMVLIAGSGQVSWPLLRRQLGKSRLTLASEAELMAATGYAIGAVAPFGLPGPMDVLIDERVLEAEEISIGSGVRGTTVIMRSADLRSALPGAAVGRFVEPHAA